MIAYCYDTIVQTHRGFTHKTYHLFDTPKAVDVMAVFANINTSHVSEIKESLNLVNCNGLLLVHGLILSKGIGLLLLVT